MWTAMVSVMSVTAPDPDTEPYPDPDLTARRPRMDPTK